MTSYLDQLHEMETFAPLDDNKLTRKDMVEDLASLVLLPEKRQHDQREKVC